MAIPAGNHRDWIWPLSLIPRKWNARESLVPPRAILHSKGATAPWDIPRPGQWNLSRGQYWWELYFALTTAGAWHARIGIARYDYVDRYYTYGVFTVKRIKF